MAIGDEIPNPIAAWRRMLRPILTDPVNWSNQDPAKLAYYTTAETAFSIIKNQVLWMRSASMMNDHQEVVHGQDCIQSALDGAEGINLYAAADECCPETSTVLLRFLSNGLGHPDTTFLSCFTEHKPTESPLGRLSMWRAYGGNAGVALVFKTTQLLTLGSDYLGAYWVPVQYADQAAVAKTVGEVAGLLRERVAELRKMQPDSLAQMLGRAIRMCALCTKHPGFAEELEWRLIAFPFTSRQHRLPTSVEVIRGIPQTVKKFELKDHVGVTGLSLEACLDEVIVGPCATPEIIRESFVQLLESVGIKDASRLVRTSDIPLRIAP